MTEGQFFVMAIFVAGILILIYNLRRVESFLIMKPRRSHEKSGFSLSKPPQQDWVFNYPIYSDQIQTYRYDDQNWFYQDHYSKNKEQIDMIRSIQQLEKSHAQVKQEKTKALIREKIDILKKQLK